jgi:hypothetical protein
LREIVFFFFFFFFFFPHSVKRNDGDIDALELTARRQEKRHQRHRNARTCSSTTRTSNTYNHCGLIRRIGRLWL